MCCSYEKLALRGRYSDGLDELDGNILQSRYEREPPGEVLRGLRWDWVIGRFECRMEEAVIVLGTFANISRIDFH